MDTPPDPRDSPRVRLLWAAWEALCQNEPGSSGNFTVIVKCHDCETRLRYRAQAADFARPPPPAGPPPADAPTAPELTEVQRKFLDALTDVPESAHVIARRLGRSHADGSAYRALNALDEFGLAVRDEAGNYRVR